MEISAFLVAMGDVVGAIVTWAWGVVSAIASGLFWLVVIVLVGFFATTTIRPELISRQRPRYRERPTTEAIREALRSGELDGEIARVISRNRERLSA